MEVPGGGECFLFFDKQTVELVIRGADYFRVNGFRFAAG